MKIFFLQLPNADTVEKLSKNERTYLIAAVIALVGAIVFLVLYIRTLHNKMIEREKDTIKIVVDVTKDFTSSNLGVKNAMDASSKASENLTLVTNQMHQTILQIAATGGFGNKQKRKTTPG